MRTNSESLLAVRMPEDINNCNDVAISSSIHVDHDTHVEFVNYGKNGDVNADKPNLTFVAAANAAAA